MHFEWRLFVVMLTPPPRNPQIHSLVFDGALANPHFYSRMRRIVHDLVQLPLQSTLDEFPVVRRLCAAAGHCQHATNMRSGVQSAVGLPLSQPAAPWWQMYELFFSISYIAPELEETVKSRINAFYQSFLPKVDSPVDRPLPAPQLASDGVWHLLWLGALPMSSTTCASRSSSDTRHLCTVEDGPLSPPQLLLLRALLAERVRGTVPQPPGLGRLLTIPRARFPCCSLKVSRSRRTLLIAAGLHMFTSRRREPQMKRRWSWWHGCGSKHTTPYSSRSLECTLQISC